MTPILGEVVAAVLPFCQDQVRREGERWGGGGRESGRVGGWRGEGEWERGGVEGGGRVGWFIIALVML